MYAYDSVFYKYINKGAIRSAEIILPIVMRYFPIHSVVDFGCGQGAWLSVWKRIGVAKIVGIDGAYVQKDSLLINIDEFKSCDLSRPINLKCDFDLVQSLEVAEHLPPNAAADFINTLTLHGRVILFSAAAPGQGGENHVNEQPYEYWRDLFRQRGYVLLDLIRPAVKNNFAIEPWYQYNSFLYVAQALFDTLPQELTKYHIDDDAVIPDFTPPLYKLRKFLLRLLPQWMLTQSAIVKKYSFVFSRQPVELYSRLRTLLNRAS